MWCLHSPARLALLAEAHALCARWAKRMVDAKDIKLGVDELTLGQEARIKKLADVRPCRF